jgi:hypothetical protein
MKKAILSIAILVSCLFFTISCGSDVQAPSGDLPKWEVRDSWTMSSSWNSGEDTSVQTVTGEQVFNGIECYTITSQEISTSLPGTYTENQKIDKTTLEMVGREFFITIDEETITSTMNISYNYSVKPYPLSVGKTWTVTVDTTTTDSLTEQNQTTPETYSLNYRVEKVESITVPAGTFHCFKIVGYSSNNSIIYTKWVTDETKGFPVKEIYNVYGTTTELISYSLSE